MNEKTRLDWYKSYSERDSAIRAETERLLGSEKTAFANSMAFLSDALEQNFDGGSIEDLTQKVKLAIAYRGRDLLWSAWDDVLCARYTVATAHFRSIDETPDFLTAIQVNPQLAGEFVKGNMKIETARRAIRNAISCEGAKSSASDWHADRTRFGSELQPFSHVSVEGAAATIPLRRGPDGKPEALVLGGAIDERFARSMCIYYAYDARILARTTAFVFQDTGRVSQLWIDSGAQMFEESHGLILRAASEVGIDLDLNEAQPEVRP